LTCGGEEVIISNPKGSDYEGCSSSTRYKESGWGCDAGFSG